MTAAAKPANPRNVKYPPRIVAFARRLHESGRTVNEVRGALAKRGYHPKRDTLLYWIDEDFREAKLMSQRSARRRASGPRRPPRRKAWRYRLDRMKELRSLGLSYKSIAAVMSHDFEDIELSEEKARFILTNRFDSTKVRTLLWPRGVEA